MDLPEKVAGDLSNDRSEAAMAQAFFHASEDCLDVASFDIDGAIWNQSRLCEIRCKKIRAR